MARERFELEQRRGELSRSLPRLSENRADTCRLNSDALALDRAGVKHQATGEMQRLKGNEAVADAAIRDLQRELRDIDTQIELMPRRGLTARVARALSPGRPVSCSALTRRAVDSFDNPGLFMVRLDRPRAMPAAAKTLEPLAPKRPERGRVAPTDRHKGGLHRYCTGCTRATEHVPWKADGRGSIPSIRWPAGEPAAGATICLNCGQLRAATSQPNPPAWSSWPRKPIAMRNLAITSDSIRATADGVSEAAAENEGMRPKREPPSPRRSARVRRIPAAARS
jgi:hypothetical protein